VVAGEHQQRRLADARQFRMPHQGELYGEILDAPERPRRLRLAVDACANLRLDRTIEWNDLRLAPVRLW